VIAEASIGSPTLVPVLCASRASTSKAQDSAALMCQMHKSEATVVRKRNPARATPQLHAGKPSIAEHSFEIIRVCL
jgi:hypothetical protein